MKCVNCKQTIPETSKVCPYCKNDPSIEVVSVTDFGAINDNIYANDEKFDIKAYVREPKNRKVVFMSVGLILVVILVFSLLLLSVFRPKKDLSYKYFTGVVDTLEEYIMDNFFLSSTKGGEYSLELDLSDYKTKFEGSYSFDLKSRNIYLDGHMRDPKEDEGQIVFENKEFTYTLYGELNNIYFKSKEFYNDEFILFPIEDNLGFLKTKKYEMNSIMDGVRDAINEGLKVVNYTKGSEEINYRGDNIRTDVLEFNFNNQNMRLFFQKFYENLLDNSNFINEFARINSSSESEIRETLENYKKTMEYKYNTDNETVNKLALYYSGKKIYRISLKYNEHMFNFDIGDTKYYFKYYKDGEEKLSFDFTSVSRQVQNITNKTIEVNYNYGEKSGVITLKLMANEKPKLKKADVETYKSVDELTDEEINQIGDNMSYYKEDIKDTIVKLFSFFDKRCDENLECVCDNGNKTCSCAYNGGMITCKYEDVKKSD